MHPEPNEGIAVAAITGSTPKVVAGAANDGARVTTYGITSYVALFLFLFLPIAVIKYIKDRLVL